MSKSRGSARRGARGIIVVAVMATVCGAAILGSAGTASAGSQVSCNGTVQPKNKKKPGSAAIYSFACTQDIRGYSVISTKQFDFFGSETNSSPNTAQSALFQCGGSVPSFGFGCGIVNRDAATPSNGNNCGQLVSGVQQPPCSNRLSAGNFISGDVGFTGEPVQEARRQDPDLGHRGERAARHVGQPEWWAKHEHGRASTAPSRGRSRSWATRSAEARSTSREHGFILKNGRASEKGAAVSSWLSQARLFTIRLQHGHRLITPLLPRRGDTARGAVLV